MSLPRRLLLGAALGTPFVARAQAEWPQRPVRWVVAFAAGGAADTAARSAAAQSTWQAGNRKASRSASRSDPTNASGRPRPAPHTPQMRLSAHWVTLRGSSRRTDGGPPVGRSPKPTSVPAANGTGT